MSTPLADRREFLSTSLKTVGISLCAFAIGSLAQSCESDIVRPANVQPTGEQVTIYLTSEPDLNSNGGAIKRAFGTVNGGNPVIVIRLSETEFVAFSSVCTHKGEIINLPKAGSNVMVCPRHDEEFLITNGAPQTDTAPSPLRQFPVQFNSASMTLVITF